MEVPGNVLNLLLVLCTTAAFFDVTESQHLKEVGRISAPHAGFVGLVGSPHASDRTDKYTVMISGFNPVPLLHDSVYMVEGVGKSLNTARGNVTFTAREVSRSVTWPNEVQDVPANVFNMSGLASVAGGFLVPSKTHGSLNLFDLSTASHVRHVLTDNSAASWFYHRVQWRDMNGDGLLDIVTCRAKKHLLGSTEGQLVWFEHPRQGALTHTWRVHVIGTGGDSFFTLASLPTPDGDVDCIITASFFFESLNIFWTTHPDKRWDQPNMVKHRVIDNTIGAVFDVIVADLNVDGNLDLLVTNNAISHASLFAYTVPTDFRVDAFPRRTLSTGYRSRTSGQGHGAPGSPVLVHPNTSATAGKPWIILSGDDEGQAHLLKPTSNSVSDWSYEQTTFLDVGSGTVGGIAAGDMEGDGYTEVFVPAFQDGVVHVFSFKTAASTPIG